MNYSAGMVSSLFWVTETRKTAELILNGLNQSDIVLLAVNENIYQVRDKDRAKRIANLTYKRLNALSKNLIEKVATSDIATAKILVLISVMKTDMLFHEFVHSVYRQSIMLGDRKITDAAINVFFDEKINQSETVANFSESAIKKLKQTYIKILFEAGVIDSTKGERNVKVPFMDYKMVKMIDESGLENYLHNLTGEA